MIRPYLLIMMALCSVLLTCSRSPEPTPEQMVELQCGVIRDFMMGRDMGSGEWQIFINPNAAWPSGYGVIETASDRMMDIETSRNSLRNDSPGLKNQTISGFRNVQESEFSLSNCAFTNDVANTLEEWRVGQAEMSKGFAGSAAIEIEAVSLNEFSRVGFNRNMTQAIFYWLQNCNGGNCHSSGYVIMNKVNGNWVESDYLLGSIG